MKTADMAHILELYPHSSIDMSMRMLAAYCSFAMLLLQPLKISTLLHSRSISKMEAQNRKER